MLFNDFFVFFIYRFFFWPLAILFILVAKRWNPKLKKLYEQRKAKHVPPKFERAPIWIHAASGEFEYAKPVIRKIKERDPAQPVVVTYFSPSYVNAITKEPGVDWSAPLPLDLPGPVHTFFTQLRPRALLIARCDVWPEVVTQARRANVPTLLFSAAIADRGGILSPLTRQFRKWLYNKLTGIFAVSSADLKNLEALKLRNVEIGGDTRFEQVLYRLEHRKPIKDIVRDHRPIFIAGSTWPEDERVLLPAVADLLRSGKMRLVIAPHELGHLNHLTEEFTEMGVEHSLYSQMSEWRTSVLIVDQVGILAELYGAADFAFVGGSFRRKVHSVMEPLAAGLVTLVGPYHANNREANEFQSVQTETGPAVIVVKSPDQMATALSAIMEDSARLTRIKWQIRGEVVNRAGASDKVMQWLDERVP